MNSVLLPHTVHVQNLNSTVVRFAEAAKPLVTDGTLYGDYRISVAVCHVGFGDGTSWDAPKTKQARAGANSSHGLHSVGWSVDIGLRAVPAVFRPCAKQKCKLQSGEDPSYTCESSDEDEFCTNCTTSCCNTLCGYPPSCSCQ